MSEDDKLDQLGKTLVRIRQQERTAACLKSRLDGAQRAYRFLVEGLDSPNVLIKPLADGRFKTAFGTVTVPDAAQVASDLRELSEVTADLKRLRELERRM